MTSERWRRLEELFSEALALPANERLAWLADVCGDDIDLLAELKSLLRSSETETRLGGLVERAADAVLADVAGHAVGRDIGPWRLVSELGAGGMGTVYLAERADDEFQRQVAIKLVRGGLLDEAARGRFRVERQILAGLEHPNIARMLDGGTTDDGMPYVVMEYVDGEPIHEFADREGLSLRNRLELFAAVCDAVEYAHSNLVVHRDLKPGNILVTRDGVPKLLDFGIARLLDAGDGEGEATRALTTAMLLTPEYASPEQIRGERVGAASDVYSLGALLYRLLTGQLPHAVAGRSPAEIERIVSTREPTRPSEAVRRTSSPDPSPASAREATGASSGGGLSLARELDGDLDLIILKALRKEPEERYGSVSRFAEDIDRYLNGLPISARAPTAGYRLRKFVRRNALGVSAAATLMLGLAGGLGAALHQARAAAEARDEAEQALLRSQAVTDYLVRVFRVADPRENLGEEISVREALDRGRDQLADLDDQPEVKADLLSQLGTIYDHLGAFPVARELRTEVVELRRGLTDAEKLVGDLNRLGIAHTRTSHYDSAALVWGEAFEIGLEALGGEHDGVLAALGNLGVAYRRLGRTEDAEATYRRAVELEAEFLDPDDANRTYALNNLGLLLTDRGDYEEAESLLREALRIRTEVSGERNPTTAAALDNLGMMLREAGRYSESEPLLREGLSIRMDALGPEHPQTSESMFALGLLLALRGEGGDFAEADSLLTGALEVRRAAVGERNVALAYHQHALGTLAWRRGDLQAAEAWLERAVALREELQQDQPDVTITALADLAVVRAAAGHLEAARENADRAVALSADTLPAEHPVTGRAHVARALVRARLEGAEAAAEFAEGLRVLVARIGAGHPLVHDACARGEAVGLSAAECAVGGGR